MPIANITSDNITKSIIVAPFPSFIQNNSYSSATVKITRACKTTSKPLTFQRASPNIEHLKLCLFEPETERKIAGNDKTAPAPTKAPIRFGEAFFVGFSPSISPDKNRIANVPMPTANWNTAANMAPYRAYITAVKRKVPAKAATE